LKNEITCRQTVVELVATYERAQKTIRDCFAQLAETEKALGAAFHASECRFSIRTDMNSRGVDFARDLDDTLKNLKEDAWYTILFERLEIGRFLGPKALKKLREDVSKDVLPEITVKAVFDVFKSFTENFDQILSDMVGEVYDFLRPRACSPAGKLKTNRPALGKKVILEVLEGRCKWDTDKSKYRVRYYYRDNLGALEKVFLALDGKGSVVKNHQAEVLTAIENSSFEEPISETEYFRCKGHKNGRLHIEFKRQDLVKKFNRLAGGKNLEAASGRP
jgi:hypothetical protein